MEERGLGEKTDNYAIYNAYLKKSNNGAQLVYKVTQNKYVLYVNGKPLDVTEVAAEAISKMLESLNVRHQPVLNLSASFEDNPQNTFPAMPSSPEKLLSSAQNTVESDVDKPRGLKSGSPSVG